ncbi:MAG TPA: DUF5652 family protein [Acidimicrobiales bacterium]|nr:DUF5652 family protein [Acidimicrobiales bacterium]
MTRKRWNDLSEPTRRLIVALATVEGVLKLWALIDLRHRPASQVRGAKAKWALAIAFVNSAGAVPIAYLIYGRRPAE